MYTAPPFAFLTVYSDRCYAAPMRAATVIFAGCLLLAGCNKDSGSDAESAGNSKEDAQNDCQRAFARIARIDSAKGEAPPMGPKSTKEAIEQCRHGQYAQYDPVLRCAMDTNTDEAASSCIDEFMDAMQKDVPPPSRGAHTGEPKGINPLLE